MSHFVDAFRTPDRARAGSAAYRALILPELVTGAGENADRLEVAVVPGASHYMVEDCPTEVADRILAWPVNTP